MTAIGKKQLESLIASGALDEFEPNRAKLWKNTKRLMQSEKIKAKTPNQEDLFDGSGLPITLEDAEPWTQEQILEKELASIGFYVSGHPLDQYEEALARCDDIIYWTVFEQMVMDDGFASERLALTVNSKKDRVSKNTGNRYAFANFSDPTGQFEAVVFSDLMDSELLKAGTNIVARIDGEAVEGNARCAVRSLQAIDTALQKK